jgi:hypothetical protein
MPFSRYFNTIVSIFGNLKNSLLLLLICSVLSVSVFGTLRVNAQSLPNFTPDYIMSDITFQSTRLFPNTESVQDYLNRINSPLKNYSVEGQSAAWWIFNSARGTVNSMYGIKPNLNPAVLLVFLEKEASLLTMRDYDVWKDPESRIAYAMGYACPDNGRCDDTYKGFKNQITWGAFQLQFNFEGARRGSNSTAPYNTGRLITTLDSYRFTISNAATAACYRYSPHTFPSCYNVWKMLTGWGWGISSNTYSLNQLDNQTYAVYTRSKPDWSPMTEQKGRELVSRKYNFGQTGQDVKDLQNFLISERYLAVGLNTGYFGENTTASTIRYRHDKGIRAGNFTAFPESTCVALIKRNFSFGTTSSEVSRLQSCLIDIGFMEPSRNTGFFGNLTTAAQEAARKLY